MHASAARDLITGGRDSVGVCVCVCVLSGIMVHVYRIDNGDGFGVYQYELGE